MNSERRHELQHNVLADYLGSLAKKVEPYTKLIAVLFTGIVVAMVAWGIVQTSATEARSDATLQLLQNANGGDAEALAEVSAQYAKTAAGEIAQLFEADTNLSSGIATLYTDREEAEGKIEAALKAYRSVASSNKDRLILSRANFGMGHALESLGKTKEAIEAYRKVVAQNESDAIVKSAQQRIDLLQKSETQEFLTWFSKQDFKPADPSLPPTLPDGNQLPDLPDLDLPEVEPLKVPDELKNDASTEGKEAPGKMTLPETTGTPAAETSPAATTAPETATATEPEAAAKDEAADTKAEPATTEPPAAENPAAEANTSPDKPAEKAAELDNPTVRVTDETE